MTPPSICSTVLDVCLTEPDNQTISMAMKLTNMEIKSDPRDSDPTNSLEIGITETLTPKTNGQDKEFIKLTNLPKKKNKSPKPSSNDTEEAPVVGDVEFNPSLLKKKKKKKPSPTTSVPFDEQLAGAEVSPSPNAAIDTPKSGPTEYKILLSRFYALLHADHPELVDGNKRFNKRIPALVLYKEPKKTIFASCPKLCEYLKRSDEHVSQYLFAELGTTGNFDGTRRLVIKGKFQQMQLETVIKRYMLEYVHCHTCKTLDTELKKGENRLVFLTCNKCESRRSVSAIKTGFVAHVGRRKNMKLSD